MSAVVPLPTPMSDALPLTLNDLSAWCVTEPSEIAGFQRTGRRDSAHVHFLHGNGFCGVTLAPMAAALPADWQLTFTDVPGHGLSPQPNVSMPDWQGMAASIATALASNNERNGNSQPMIGVGHSMGGVITLLMAVQQPHLFSRIVLMDPVLFTPEIVLIQRMMRATGFWRRTALVKKVAARRAQWPNHEAMWLDLQRKSLYAQWHPSALWSFIQHGSIKDVDGVNLACSPSWEAGIFGSYPRGLWAAIDRVKIPVDIWVAEQSYPFIAKAASKASQANPNIRWQRFGQRHCFPMEQPEASAALLQAILK